jgi:hypothetical protein
MIRSLARLACATCVIALLLPVVSAYGAPDDALPGVPLAYPQAVSLDSVTDTDDVFSIYLNQGDVLVVRMSLQSGSAEFDPMLLLLAPGAPNLWADEVARTQGSVFPKALAYTATRTGTYFLVAHQSPYGPASSGSATLTWTVSSPVYRFYNAGNGTHFYTPSPEELSMVISKWSDVFAYEGVVYYTQPYRNTQPLYRFYNRRSASHFYTASLDEANSVILKWSNVFTYEGTTYKVSPYGPANAAVYRFYNKRNGSHFFTASAEERDTVIARWSATYTYEGVAFYLNP